MTDEETTVAVATRVFAELGYDSTGLELIADAAGTDVRALSREAGGKAGLYRTVMREAFRTEQEMLETALADFRPTIDGAYEVADAYLDFYVENPRILALWMHRWMGDASDLGELEAEYVDPQADFVNAAIRELIPPDVNVNLLVRTVVWCVFGFLSGGLPGALNRAGARRTSAEIAEFRAHLHTLLARMLTPAE